MRKVLIIISFILAFSAMIICSYAETPTYDISQGNIEVTLWPDGYMTVEQNGTEINYEVADIVFTGNTDKYYIIVNTADSEGNTINVLFDNLHINNKKVEDEDGNTVSVGNVACIMDLTGKGSVINLTLKGENVLAGGDNYAGLQTFCDSESTGILYIRAEEGASLHAAGGMNGAGIGGGTGYDGRNIVIESGYIEATTEMFGAAIGGGFGGSAGNITINGGTVIAEAFMGAGIGCGYSGTNGIETLYINGGTVYSSAGEDSFRSSSGEILEKCELSFKRIGDGLSVTDAQVQYDDGSVVEYSFDNSIVHDNSLVLWLPTGAHLSEVTVDGIKYKGFCYAGYSDSAKTDGTFGTIYNLTVLPVEHGILSVDQTSAYPGQIIRVYAKPDSGYVPSAKSPGYIYGSLSKTRDMTLSEDDEYIYTFVMPSDHTTISASFLLSVDIGPAKEDIVVSGKFFVVKNFFDISRTNGDITYKYYYGGSGSGKLLANGRLLRVDKPGTFEIKCISAETDKYVAANYTVTIEVTDIYSSSYIIKLICSVAAAVIIVVAVCLFIYFRNRRNSKASPRRKIITADLHYDSLQRLSLENIKPSKKKSLRKKNKK